jgi:UDP-N-acetylmuramoyl-L-alanyl-D-glutamate--2,6-diaminopimelate ligase
MHIAQLIADLPIDCTHGDLSREVTGVVDDSRRAKPGCLFIARPGTAENGAKYIDQAIDAGAMAVLSERTIQLPDEVVSLRARRVGPLTGQLAERFHGQPSGHLQLVGVTGTNGKTTVAYMIRHLLNATGIGCGMLSTVAVDLGDGQPRPATLTTPGACEISQRLAAMVSNGCKAAVMECSSHALDQGRCDALKFDAAVFTNLTGDHLDYHASVEAYAAAKAKLFGLLGSTGVGVVNRDDPRWRQMIGECAGRFAEFSGRGHVDAPYSGRAARMTDSFTGIDMLLPIGQLCVRSALIGGHNVENLMAALATVIELGIEPHRALDAVATIPPVPGRLERITAPDAPFTVLVDYAHTDDALGNVLNALRPLLPTGAALGVLFGCGGDRDTTKRPRMGRIACDLADRIVITSDNPRTEDPDRIIEQIIAGVPEANRRRATTIADRREAIAHIIDSAGEQDIVLIAGKGHEDYQIIGTTKQPFDDRVEAAAAVRSRLG